MNVVTRSGSNAWHGSAFAFFRDESLSEDNFLSGTRTPFQQTQYGASLSGPILRDRLFFFAVAERLAVADANVVTISDADFDMIRAAGFDIQNGVVPFDRNADSVFGRLDLLPSPSHAFSLRGTYARSLDENQQAWGGPVARSSGGVRNLEDGAVGLTGTSILTASLSNELRALYADRSHRLDSLDPRRSPQVTIVGVATFGTQPLLPNPRDTQVYQIFDAISWFGGRSAYKAGFDYTHTTFAGSVPANFAGVVPVRGRWDGRTAREAFAAGLPSFFGQGFGDPYWEGTTSVLGAFVQGEWNLTDRLLLRLGLRYDYEKPADPLPSDENNWAPRLSFSWAGTDAWRVRGGLGRFYGVAAIVPMFAVAVNNGIQTVYTGRILGSRGSVPGGAMEPAGPPLLGSDERRDNPRPSARRAARRLRERDASEPRPRGLRSVRERLHRPGQPRIRDPDRPPAATQRRLPVRPRQKHHGVTQHQPSHRWGTSTEPRLRQHLPRLGLGQHLVQRRDGGLADADRRTLRDVRLLHLRGRRGRLHRLAHSDSAPGSLEPARRARAVHPRSQAQGHPRGDLYDRRARGCPGTRATGRSRRSPLSRPGARSTCSRVSTATGMAICFPTARRESRATADSSRTPSTWTCGSRAPSRSVPWLSKRRWRCSTSSTARTCFRSTMSAT